MAKFKSLKETRWTRFRAFLRGLLLYNTVYWQRASDGVNRDASRVGRKEREQRRPQVDPELLRPRVPRPGGEQPARPTPEQTEEERPPVTPAAPRRPEAPPVPRLAMPVTGEELFGSHFRDAADDALQSEVSARRKRRVVRRRELRDKAVDPGRILRARAEAKPKRPLPGWFRWLIGWHH